MTLRVWRTTHECETRLWRDFWYSCHSQQYKFSDHHCPAEFLLSTGQAFVLGLHKNHDFENFKKILYQWKQKALIQKDEGTGIKPKNMEVLWKASKKTEKLKWKKKCLDKRKVHCCPFYCCGVNASSLLCDTGNWLGNYFSPQLKLTLSCNYLVF